MEAAEKKGNDTLVKEEDYLKEPEMKVVNAEEYFFKLKPFVYKNK